MAPSVLNPSDRALADHIHKYPWGARAASVLLRPDGPLSAMRELVPEASVAALDGLVSNLFVLMKTLNVPESDGSFVDPEVLLPRVVREVMRGVGLDLDAGAERAK
jgi:hypothetical protein